MSPDPIICTEREQNSESGPVLIIANGTGILDYPPRFLLKYPRFTMNYFPYHYRFVDPMNWVAYDLLPGADFHDTIMSGMWKNTHLWIPLRNKEHAVSQGWHGKNLHFWKGEKQEGFGYSEELGLSYTSVIHMTCHIALFLGYSPLLVVGFDCTTAEGIYTEKGFGAAAHFYDNQLTKNYAMSWDRQMAFVKANAEKEGKRVINISTISDAKFFPIEDSWRNW